MLPPPGKASAEQAAALDSMATSPRQREFQRSGGTGDRNRPEIPGGEPFSGADGNCDGSDGCVWQEDQRGRAKVDEGASAVRTVAAETDRIKQLVDEYSETIGRMGK
jgi:hypothetical protein